MSWTNRRQTWDWPSHAAASLWAVLLTSYFSSVSAGCAVKQKYHSLCKNPRSAQFLPWEIVTFCAEIGLSGLEKERGKSVSGVSKVLISFQSSRAKGFRAVCPLSGLLKEYKVFCKSHCQNIYISVTYGVGLPDGSLSPLWFWLCSFLCVEWLVSSGLIPLCPQRVNFSKSLSSTSHVPLLCLEGSRFSLKAIESETSGFKPMWPLTIFVHLISFSIKWR